MRIDLPSGGWAEFRNFDEVRGLKRAMRSRIRTDMTAGAMANEGHTAVMAKVITAWELPYLPGAALPSEDPSIVDELDDDDNDVLEDHLKDLVLKVFGKQVTPDDVDDPTSPTAPASA